MKRWGEKRLINILVYGKTDVNSGKNINKVGVMIGNIFGKEGWIGKRNLLLDLQLV